jgi:uncharacterized protein YodC (DUF2158 family)
MDTPSNTMPESFLKFQTGDQVKLKSGGPTMTVATGRNTNQQVACKWMDNEITPIMAQFSENMLQRVGPLEAFLKKFLKFLTIPIVAGLKLWRRS